MNVKDEELFVSVCITTYNQEKYIEETIISVLEQDCNFNYEIIVSNDFSSDKTNEVIKRIIDTHPQANKIRYFDQSKNLGMMGNLIFTLNKAKSKYIALLEGDDYWLDKLKLQKQFDLMENNSSFSICTGGLKSFIPGEGIVERTLDEKVHGKVIKLNSIEDFRSNYLNIFFRKSALDIEQLAKLKYAGDNVIFLLALTNGDVYFINEVLGFRRTHENGLWTTKNATERYKFDFNQLSELYTIPILKKSVRRRLFHVSINLIGSGRENKIFIFSAAKLIRSPKELEIFIKRVVKCYFFSKK